MITEMIASLNLFVHACMTDRAIHKHALLQATQQERREQFQAYVEVDEEARNEAQKISWSLQIDENVEQAREQISALCNKWREEECRAREMAQDATDTASAAYFRARRAGLELKRDFLWTIYNEYAR